MLKFINIYLFFLTFFVLNNLNAYDVSSFNLINKYRYNAGLNTLKYNNLLEDAAFNHSLYNQERIELKQEIGHEQKFESKLFSGVTPSQRAEFVGYTSNFVSENFTYINYEYKNKDIVSVDMLFTAIYHRFGFLNPLIDEIGFTKTKDLIKLIY